MRVITRKRLRDFYEERFPDAKGQLVEWYRMMKAKTYGNPHELQQDFPKASFIGNNRTVFDICGGKYRLTVDMKYSRKQVYIRSVLTHEEYDRRRGTL